MPPVPSEEGDFSTLWRLCIESPSQPKLASSLHNKRLSYWRLTGFRQNDGGCGPAFLKSAAKPPPPPFEPFEPERRRRLSIRRLYGFRRQRRYKKWRPKGRHTFPAERCYIPPEGGALNPPVRRSRSQAEPLALRAAGPIAPSTLAAKPRQPSGIQVSAETRKSAATFCTPHML